MVRFTKEEKSYIYAVVSTIWSDKLEPTDFESKLIEKLQTWGNNETKKHKDKSKER